MSESVRFTVIEELAGSCVALLLMVKETDNFRVMVSVFSRLFVRVGGSPCVTECRKENESLSSFDADVVSVISSLIDFGVRESE